METIREYLNNLFLGFPETPAVLRAKAELLEMMEDKYEEYLKEGKSEKEAVGTVISEFGNIEELAEELGISDYLHERQEKKEGEGIEDKGKNQEMNEVHDGLWESASAGQTGYQGSQNTVGRNGAAAFWSLSQAKEYVAYAWKHGWMIGIGVACFICSCFLNSIIDDIGDTLFIHSEFFEFLGDVVFFLGVAAGVTVLVFAGRLKNNYPVVVKGKRIAVDEETAEYMKGQRTADEDKRFRLRLIGILLIVFCVVPGSSSILVSMSLPVFRDILDNSVLLFVAAGVLLVVVSASVENRYQEFAKAAVTVPKEHISFSGFDGTYEGGQENYEEASWNPGSESRVFEGYQRKQRKSLPWIIAGVVVFFLLFLCVFGVAAFLGVRRSVSTEIEEEMTEAQAGKELHESYPANEVNKVQIDLDVADVIVKSGDVENIVLDYKGKEQVAESLSNGTLVIKEQNSHGWISFHLFSFGWGNHEGSLQLTVPKNLYGSSEAFRGGQTLSVATDTGDVQLKEVYFDEVSVDADTGDVSLENVGGMGKGILVDADTGDVVLSDITGEKVEVDADTGDVNVKLSEGEIFGGLDCDLDTGNFRMTVPMGKEGFLRTFATDFSTDLEDQIRFFGTKLTAREASKKRQGSEPFIKVSVDTGMITIVEAE